MQVYNQYHTNLEKIDTISSKVRNEARCSLAPILVIIVLEFLTKEIRHYKYLQQSNRIQNQYINQ
jgi:uncharacterized membrane protein YidH (DUF202 family)